MSDDTDVEKLLENFQKETLKKINNIESLIGKLDVKNNRKLLKKVKTVVSDVHGKFNSIKEKVSKAYKRVKVRTNSENDDSVNDSTEVDASDKEDSTDKNNKSLEESIIDAGRFSPIIGSGKKTRKSSRKLGNSENSAAAPENGVVGSASKDKDRSGENMQDSNKESEKDDTEATKKDDSENVEKSTGANNKEDEEESEKDENTSQEIIEATPEKQPPIKLSLRRNQNKDVSVVVLDRASKGDISKDGNESDDEKATKKDEGKTEKAKSRKTRTGKSAEENESNELDQNEEEDGKNKSKTNRNKEDNPSDNENEKVSEKSDDAAEKGKSGKSTVKNKSNKSKDKEDDPSDNEKETILEEQMKSDKKSEEKGDLIKKDKPTTPMIKLVDISKLLAPNSKPMEMTPTPTKNRKSVTFDSSVIVLTSSDEDSPKKTPKEKKSTPLKSALRKSSSKTLELSDDDSKENDDENLRNKKSVTRKHSTKDESSDDSDHELRTARSRRAKDHAKEVKSRFSELRKKRDSKITRSIKKRHEDANSSDEETPNKNRRTRRNKDKKLESESDGEDKSSTKSNSKKRRKKELLEESSLTEDSDEGDDLEVELQKSSKTRKVGSKASFPDANPDDPKFKSEVYIRLPKFKCEELPELYKKKREIFEIKKLCKTKLPLRANRNASKASEDPEKSESKKIKLTLKLNKKKKKEDSSDDDERSSTEDVEDKTGRSDEKNNGEAKSIEDVDMTDLSAAVSGGVADGMEALAMSCLDQIEENSEKEDTLNDKENLSEDAEVSKSEKTKKVPEKSDEKGTAKTKEPLVNGTASDSEEEPPKKSTNKRKNKNDDSSEEDSNKKAVTTESSDSDDDFSKFSKKKDKARGALVREAKKRMKKKVISDSESEEDASKQKKGKDSDEDFKADKGSDSSDEKASSSSDSEKEKEKDEESKSSRKRIKRVGDSSSSDDEDKTSRKKIRRMIDRDSLSETTLKAEQEEKARKARIAEKQKKYNQIFELKADATVDKVVLDFDEKSNKPLLSVHKKLVKQLKPHQVHGVKFMWDACFESLSRAKKTEGSGCILAHCMGLGKTLQVITLAHTLLTNQEKTKVEKIMVVCPVNTVLNWKSEFKKWIPDEDDFEVYELVSCKANFINHERNHIVKSWHEGGGVLIIGYNMFRNLSNPDNKALSKKLRESFQTGLVDPGPDLVVCDEGHLLKNERTHLSIAMNRIKTARRIVLTGTPLQNNLREYWCMVQFIKPNLLGTYKEYLNRFVNPIINGQYTDSTQHDIQIMRRRSHVLHKLLDGVVQRQDYAVLAPYLPPKHEYVLFVSLTEVQQKLYQHYMDNFARRGDGSNRTSFLFTDFQWLQRICTHPRVLLDKSMEDKEKKDMNDESDSEGSLKEFIDDGSGTETPDTSSEGSQSGSESDASDKSDTPKKKRGKPKSASASRRTRVTRAQAAEKRENGEASNDSDVEEVGPKEWWEDYINKAELDNINHSAKIFLLFQILKECEEIGDKVLVFSQSLYTLNCLEYFLARIDEATQQGDTEKVGGHSGSWALGLDYFRLDGSSSCDNRASWCDEFNNPENTRARLFLISTKAGGLGINLVAANRVIIFDVSWNPSHDIQSIYRVYRFGQNKPSYIYRFVTYGSMEMKIYERQVTKQAISKRVIDEQQIDRHYSQNDIQELYKTDLSPSDRPIPMVPKDVLLGEMLQKYDKTIYRYHEHQSLLENKQDEELNEEERKAAWEEFENEKVIRKTTVTNFAGANLAAFVNSNQMSFSPQIIQMALASIVKKDNPTWSDVQIKGILPALVTQLQVQMSENDFTMYNRVQQEIRLMQALHAQRIQLLKQYQMQQMLQKQQQAQQQMLGSLNVTPEDIRAIQMARATQNFIPTPQTSRAGRSSDVIELND